MITKNLNNIRQQQYNIIKEFNNDKLLEFGIMSVNNSISLIFIIESFEDDDLLGAMGCSTYAVYRRDYCNFNRKNYYQLDKSLLNTPEKVFEIIDKIVSLV